MSGGWGTPSWMGGEPDIGETFVQGKDTPTARALLAAAEALGIDPIAIRTVARGFVVPNEVWDAAQDALRSQHDDTTI